MLPALREYAGRLSDMAPEGYLEKPIRYVIELDGDGRVLGVIDQAQGSGSRDKRGRVMPAPEVGRTSSAIRPRLFADNGEYTLGKPRAATPTRKATTAQRAGEVHAAYVALVVECAVGTGEPSVAAIADLLTRVGDVEPYLPEDFDAEANVTFRVAGVLPIELPAVRQYWARRVNPSAAGNGDSGHAEGTGEEGGRLQCLVCGEVKPAMKRLAYKWKGIYGGQAGGLSLISADADAFESYGQENSLIAPTCAECGELFSKAANDLLAKDETRVRIGPIAYIFWTREETGFNFGTFLNDPQPADVKALLEAYRTGLRATATLDATQFYAAAFSASGGRVVVRDWLDATLGTAKEHLARYFRLQEIVGPDGAEAPPLKLVALAGSTVRELKDLTPEVTKALLRVALGGGPVPKDLLFEAVRRCRAEGKVNRQHAALIKMVLLDEREQVRRASVTDQELVRLDEQSREPAYLCGRLLAILEAVQREALGDINASIVDRFFGTASSAPASVFARLVRGAQPHLKTLSRDKPGMHNIFENQLMDVMQGISGRDGFPMTLDLEKQGLFALGYYHQRAADRAERIARASRRRAAEGRTGNDSGVPE